jgi:3-methyladenine DNA glycosylase AlkD
MNLETAMAALTALADESKASAMRSTHKVDRPYLGIANTDVDAAVKSWRAEMDVAQRVELARDLWGTNVHEARIAAAKLLTQARLRPDTEAWELILGWVPEFDTPDIADAVCTAGQKRVVADPSRLDDVEKWIDSDHMWSRRAAFQMTLPWTKQNFPKPAEIEARTRVLGWAARLVEDKQWFVQKAISTWLRDLSKHDTERAIAWLDEFGPLLKPFARKESTRHMRDYTVPAIVPIEDVAKEEEKEADAPRFAEGASDDDFEGFYEG